MLFSKSANTWTLLPLSLTYPRAGSRASVFGDGSQVWIVGGFNDDSQGFGIREIEIFGVVIIHLYCIYFCVFLCLCVCMCVCV